MLTQILLKNVLHHNPVPEYQIDPEESLKSLCK